MNQFVEKIRYRESKYPSHDITMENIPKMKYTLYYTPEDLRERKAKKINSAPEKRNPTDKSGLGDF